MRSFCLYLTLAVAKVAEHVVTLGNTIEFSCHFDKMPGKEQVIFIKFTDGVSKKEESIFQSKITNDTVSIGFNKDKRYKFDGLQFKIVNVKLGDEGNYRCRIEVWGTQEYQNFEHYIEVRVKPAVDDIIDMAKVNKDPLVDIPGTEVVERDGARCVASSAKPKATIHWEYESIGLGNPNFSVPISTQNEDRTFNTTSIFQLIPKKHLNNQIVKCIINHPELEEALVKKFKINVQFPPTIPKFRPVQAQSEISCYADANPEPNYMWIMPDTTQMSGTTVNLMDLQNPNGTYKCTVENLHGREANEISNADITSPETTPTVANLPIILAIAISVIVVICILGYCIYKFVLQPMQEELEHPYPKETHNGSIVTTYPHNVMTKTPNSEDEDSDDEDRPVLSKNNASNGYEALNKANPQNSTGRPTSYNTYLSEGQDEYDDNDDELIDNAADRFADYNSPQVSARLRYNQAHRSYDATDINTEMV